MKLKSIAKEASDCRAAWAAVPDAKYGAHIHHGSQPFEALSEPIENRIAYILTDKPEQERAARLRHMRPMSEAASFAYDEAVAPAWRTYDKAEAAAWRTYDKAEAAARKVYNEAEAAARKVYNEAEAAARKVYNEAEAAAGKAYDEAEAAARRTYNEAAAAAWRTFREARSAAHAEHCPVPDCQWDGDSIFGGAS